MFDRFSQCALEAVGGHMVPIAASYGSEQIELDHLVLATLDTESVDQLLSSLGITSTELRDRFAEPSSRKSKRQTYPFAPATKEAIERAAENASEAESITAAHLLLAAVEVDLDGRPVQAFASLGVPVERLRFGVDQLPSYPPGSNPVIKHEKKGWLRRLFRRT